MSTHRPLPISPDHQDEVLDELTQLREEVVNTRHVVIKTDHVIKNLNAEIKQITQKQAAQERKSLFNSATAYVLFVILILGGLYLNFQSKVDTHEVKLEKRDRLINALEREVFALKSDLGRWEQVERDLLEFGRLVREGEKEEAIRRFSSLRLLSFSGLLEVLIVKFKSEVAKEKYEQGKKSYDQKNYLKADEMFMASLAYIDLKKETPDYFGNLLYHQGMSTLYLEKYQKAAELLKKAQTFSHKRKIQANIDYNLARSHDMMGNKLKARRLYYRFYLRYRHVSGEQHRTARAKRRYESLDKKK